LKECNKNFGMFHQQDNCDDKKNNLMKVITD